MNEYSLFRLKLQYKAADQETGDVVKNKVEILAQCVNFTDAETLVNKLIAQYEMNKFEPCIYDIVKGKFDATEIYGGEPMKCDDEDALTCGLIQHYFDGDGFGLYAVDTVVFGEKDAKDTKETYYIPAEDAAEAVSKAKIILRRNGNDESNFIVPGAKLDNADMIYLRPSTTESITNRATEIFG